MIVNEQAIRKRLACWKSFLGAHLRNMNELLRRPCGPERDVTN